MGGRGGGRQAACLPTFLLYHSLGQLGPLEGDLGARGRGREEWERSKKRGDRKEKNFVHSEMTAYTHTLWFPLTKLPPSLPFPPLLSPPLSHLPLSTIYFLILCEKNIHSSSTLTVSHHSFWNPMLLSWLHRGKAPDRLVAPVLPREPGQNAQSLVRPSSHFQMLSHQMEQSPGVLWNIKKLAYHIT